MPTRPTQTDPEQARQWAQYRVAVGARIREHRKARGLTQESLALRSGVTRNILIDVEQGRRGILYERLFDIAKALGVPASDFLDIAIDGI